MKAFLVIAILLLTGCASSPKPPGYATQFLILHPGYEAASQAAPRWVEQALAEIAELETALDHRK